METARISDLKTILDQVKTNTRLVVEDISGGWNMRQRLNQMGIHTGDILSVKRCCAMKGPVLVRVHGLGVALGRGIARHILVRLHDETIPKNDTEQAGRI